MRLAILTLILGHALSVSAIAQVGLPREDVVQENSEQENSEQEDSAQESTADKNLEIFKQVLEKRFARDQKARWDLINYSKVKNQNSQYKLQLMKTASDIDGQNVEWLRNLIDRYGWPSSTLFTDLEREKFFVLVLHADRDRKFQKKCLKLMKGLEDGQWQDRYHQMLEARVKVRPPRKVFVPAR